MTKLLQEYEDRVVNDLTKQILDYWQTYGLTNAQYLKVQDRVRQQLISWQTWLKTEIK